VKAYNEGSRKYAIFGLEVISVKEQVRTMVTIDL